MNVLKFVAGQNGDGIGLSKSDTRCTRRQRDRSEIDTHKKLSIERQKIRNKAFIPRTPSVNRTLNPLDDKRMMMMMMMMIMIMQKFPFIPRIFLNFFGFI
uniref:G-patch domain-containing protein n=1 Tax=Heterorhabditis bacteriophora TaxID=37862 RepID=A0A1I7W8K0_HETBA